MPRPEGILFEIAGKVREDLERRRALVPESVLLGTLGDTRVPRDFAAALTGDAMSVIAEVKLASPSAGDLAPGADPVAVARTYLESGAAAISVLTERSYFKGSPENLRRIREAFPHALLLKKDFIIDEYQLLEARHEGADAVLLIQALLGSDRLKQLQSMARDLDLTALVEVHDEQELAAAVGAGAALLGVNNRDLRTLKISLDVSRRLAPLLPRDRAVISESGITKHEELAELRALGYRGALVGSSLMRETDPGHALRSLIGGAP